MIGVQHEDAIHGPGDHRVDGVALVLGERAVQEVLRVTEAGGGRRRRRQAAQASIGERREHRHLGDQAHRGGGSVGFDGDVEPVVVFGRQRAGERRHHPHRMRLLGEQPRHLAHPRRQRPRLPDRFPERALRGGTRQLAAQQQLAEFKEVRTGGQLLDGIAAMQQHAGVAVDVGDVGVAGCGGDESRVVGEVAFGGEIADVDDVVAEAGAQHRQFDGLAIRHAQRRPLARRIAIARRAHRTLPQPTAD